MKLTAIVYGLIDKGWGVFTATATLLKLGAVAFLAAIAGFIISGVGIIVVGILAIVGFGAYEGIKYLYSNKWYPLAILKVSTMVKPDYERSKYDDEEVSRILDKTVELLIDECR